MHDHAQHRSDDRRRLACALGITVTVLLVEAVGAAVTGSLALLADAGHLATDALGLGAALVASILATRPATARRTFGFGRAEVLAAALNALVLLAVAGFVAVEALSRLSDPPPVPGLPLLVIGAFGLAGNLVALRVLAGGDRHNLNLRGALLEVFGDALGSIAVLVAAVVVLTTGAGLADPIASLAIAALIAPRAFVLLRDAAHVLLEGAPVHLDADDVHRVLRDVPGVFDVHDLHLWSITSGRHAVSAHLVVGETDPLHCGGDSVLDSAEAALRERFGLTHSTLQLEHGQHAEHEPPCH